jgi:hypothetical protein
MTFTPHLRPLLPPLAALALVACGGPPVPSPVENELSCFDYESLQHEKMAGGGRFPVELRILDGKKPISTTLFRGLRDLKAPKTQVMLPDADHEYTLEWAQCENRQAERKAAEGQDPAYKCENAKVYKTAKLATKKGDAASRTVRFAIPPDATCHIGILPEMPGQAPPAGSGAPLVPPIAPGGTP